MASAAGTSPSFCVYSFEKEGGHFKGVCGGTACVPEASAVEFCVEVDILPCPCAALLTSAKLGCEASVGWVGQEALGEGSVHRSRSPNLLLLARQRTSDEGGKD